MTFEEIEDSNAEAGVVSTLLYHPEFILHSPHLKEKYFRAADNQCIFGAIKKLYLENKVTNMNALNIEQALKTNSEWNESIKEFNLPDFQQYIDLCRHSKRDTVEEYLLLVNRVVELSFKRDFYLQTEDWKKTCSDTQIPLEEFSSQVYKNLNSLTANYMTGGDVVLFGDKVESIWEKVKGQKERGETYGFPSYFPSVKKFFSYEKTELVVISARMKEGKSWIAMFEALHKAMNGVPTLIYDSEMSDENWFFRVAGSLTGIPVDRLKNEKLTPEEEQKMEETIAYIKTIPLIRISDPFISKEKFYSICAQKKNEIGLQFVVWDYIKGDDSILDTSMRSAYMAGIANWLKNTIAKELGLAVLAFAQLNRQHEVAESDGIERACSVSVRWRKKIPDEIEKDGVECGTHKLSVLFNRSGIPHEPGDYIDMKFLKNCTGITEAKQHKEDDYPF